MSSPSSVRSRDGTDISFDRSGSGPALILVEPAGHFRGLSAFDALVPLLTPDFTVYGYDRRGRGRSGDTAPYDPAREVEDLHALIREAGGKAFVYGYSSGALLALHAAARKVPLAGIVVLEPPLQPELKDGPDPLTGQLGTLIGAGRHDDAVKLFHMAIGVPHEMIDEMRGTEAWARMSGIAPTLVYDCMLSDATTPAVCRSVNVPTLVLDSEGSTDNLSGSAAAAARLIPNARHKSLPGEWHTVAPALIAAEIKRFFGPLVNAREPL
jgi:pimeloyl-ACP methyl ester carboxylesterase